MLPLNIFYEEPDLDRWFPFDRYPRKIIRQAVRGARRPGGQERVFLNLLSGLDRLSAPYRVNDYGYARKHPEETVGIIGKPHVLDRHEWKNPIVFGASIFSHPFADRDLFDRLPVKKVIVPGQWMRDMFRPCYGDRVVAWPVGIDTDEWTPVSQREKKIDFLIYNKVRWEKEKYEKSLVSPIRESLKNLNLSFNEICYGSYKEEDFHDLLSRSRAMIFICEHETQGIAYQQALACGVPLLAWDRGGFWQDPSYYPHAVKFSPVSSVPYWDSRCGLKFSDATDFSMKLAQFIEKERSGSFAPRSYVLEHLTLEKSARQYIDIYKSVEKIEMDNTMCSIYG